MTLSTSAIERLQAVPAEALDRAIPELGSFVRAVADSPLLARTLSQADIPAPAKRSLVSDVVGGRYSDATLDAVAAVVGTVDRANDVAEALAEALSIIVFRSAEEKDQLAQLEQRLGAFAEAIRQNDNLRDALTNAGVNVGPKQSFIDDLLKAGGPGLLELTKTALALQYGKNIDTQLIALADAAAARRGTVIADVKTAVELDDQRKQALLAALSSQAGKPVEARFTVDPEVLGSVIVRIGDEVLDGTVRHRLDQARLAMAGAQ